MSRANRRKPGSRPEQRPVARFTLSRKVEVVVAAQSIGEAFSDLELEFFRKGDELPAEHHDDPPDPELDTAWPTPAAEQTA
jgi:hypothetical protein